MHTERDTRTVDDIEQPAAKAAAEMPKPVPAPQPDAPFHYPVAAG